MLGGHSAVLAAFGWNLGNPGKKTTRTAVRILMVGNTMDNIIIIIGEQV